MGGPRALPRVLYVFGRFKATSTPPTPPTRAADADIVRGRLDRRTAMTVSKYKGNTEEWRDWSICFKRLMLSMEYVVYTTMNDVEKETGEVNEDDDYSENTEENAIRRKESGELFDLLCSLCEGDALAVVTATEDCKGFLAWQRLASKCNARTMARAISVNCVEASGFVKKAPLKT